MPLLKFKYAEVGGFFNLTNSISSKKYSVQK